MKSYDLVVIGAGPAGMTAGLYAVRSGLKTAVISKDIGGTANSILELENWPGFSGKGAMLMKQFYDQLKEYENVDFIMDDVVEVSKKENKFLLKTKKKEFEAKAIVVATGTERRKLNIPGEKELTGKGVSYCVTCDAFFFKDKIAGVVGGSDCAATSALALSDIAKKVFVFYRGEKLRCEDITAERLERKENVEIVYNAVPKEIIGEGKLEKIKFDVSGEEKEFELEGVFVEIGSTPTGKCLEKLGVEVDEGKHIIVNDKMETSVEGLYAAGDVTNQKLQQVVVASGHGAIAAKNAYDFVSKKFG